MKTTIKYLAPWLAAAAIGGAIALAPIAGAAATPERVTTTVTPHAPDTGTDPLVPYGTDPQVPYRLGYVNPNHDEGNTTNGELDLPF
jgi:hypothetical protein